MIEKIRLGIGAFFGLLAASVIWLSGVIVFLISSLTAYKYFMLTEAVIGTVGVFLGVGFLATLALTVVFMLCGGISAYMLK